MSKKKWNKKVIKSFATEKYLIDALESDPDYTSFGGIMNKMILLVIGDDNNAVKQFKEEHPEYK